MIALPDFANAQDFQINEGVVAQLHKDAETRALHEEAQRKIAEDQQDPTQQRYIQRLDTKGLVKTDEEFAICVATNVPIREVSYAHALKILEEADAAIRARKAKKKARKVARASRKRNR